jgi:hypothetical protein
MDPASVPGTFKIGGDLEVNRLDRPGGVRAE